MPPDFLVTHTFASQPCGVGINPRFSERLSAVEDELRSQFDALEDKTNPLTGTDFASHVEWLELHEPLVCWRPNAGHHSAGAAADINVTTNPYIVTRTGSTLGGEFAGRTLTTIREQAVAVYDRAVEFSEATGAQADVSARGDGELTSDVYDRFLPRIERISLLSELRFQGN